MPRKEKVKFFYATHKLVEVEAELIDVVEVLHQEDKIFVTKLPSFIHNNNIIEWITISKNTGLIINIDRTKKGAIDEYYSFYKERLQYITYETYERQQRHLKEELSKENKSNEN